MQILSNEVGLQILAYGKSQVIIIQLIAWMFTLNMHVFVREDQ